MLEVIYFLPLFVFNASFILIVFSSVAKSGLARSSRNQDENRNFKLEQILNFLFITGVSSYEPERWEVITFNFTNVWPGSTWDV